MSTSHAPYPEHHLEQPHSPRPDHPAAQDHSAGPAIMSRPTSYPARRRSLRLPTHGPRGARWRTGLAVVLDILVFLASSAVLLVTGVLPGQALPSLVVVGAVFVLLTALFGGSMAVSKSWNALRAPLLVGYLMVTILGIAWLLGLRSPALGGLVEVVALSSISLAILRALLTVAFRPRTVVICATDELLSQATTKARAVLGVVDPDTASPRELVAAAVAAVDQVDGDLVRVVGTLPDDLLAHLSWGLRSRGTPLEVDLLEGSVASSRITTSGSDGASVLVTPPTPPIGQRVVKRLMDIVGSSVLILLLSPLLIGTAIAIKLDDGGPIFFGQIRIGRNGRPFGILKFRTMAVDADARLQELLRRQNTDGTPLFKVQDDPRLTRIGGFLRRYSIDELPQLFNVLLGTMSLVGPRPQRKAETELYTGTAAHRLGVSPGMTGLWQVSGRSNLSWEEAQRLDVHYAHNWSIGTDISILLRTVKAVVGKDGAY